MPDQPNGGLRYQVAFSTHTRQRLKRLQRQAVRQGRAYAGVVLNCALGIFNLIPIPPLDGSWVLMRFLRLRHIIALQHFRFVGLTLVALLLASPMTSRLFYGPLRLAVHACLDLCGVPRAGSPL